MQEIIQLLSHPLAELGRALPSKYSTLIDRTRELTGSLQEQNFPLVFEHGDLSAPNILVSEAGELGVVDWELARPRGLPGQDLFFALSYIASARCGAAGPEQFLKACHSAFFGPHAWTRPFVDRYARSLALPNEVLKSLFVACWFRYVATFVQRLGESGAQLSARRTAERLENDRYFRLWSHVVQHWNELLPQVGA